MCITVNVTAGTSTTVPPTTPTATAPPMGTGKLGRGRGGGGGLTGPNFFSQQMTVRVVDSFALEHAFVSVGCVTISMTA